MCSCVKQNKVSQDRGQAQALRLASPGVCVSYTEALGGTGFGCKAVRSKKAEAPVASRAKEEAGGGPLPGWSKYKALLQQSRR